MFQESTIPSRALEYPKKRHEEATAEDFLESYGAICALEREVLAKALNLPAHKLTPSYLASHLQAENGDRLLSKIDRILNSEHNGPYIEKCVELSEHAPALLRDEHSRSYVTDLAREGIMSGLIQAFLDTKKLPWDMRQAYKAREIRFNDHIVDLVDSQYGEQLGITRGDLRHIIRAAYGPHDAHATINADMLEAGLAVEIATKKYMETAESAEGLSVRYGSADEDKRGGDIICQNGEKTLIVDVKSGDKNETEPEDARPFHTPLIEEAPNVYKIRQLHPASHRAIGENFEIKAGGYKREIDSVFAEFAAA